ncbi:DUF6801 domain-containing protein [Streptomyces sp. 061-3]|uniref:DUF6801 domain-containing protein n=1 Tax=Streptomyces sp. 061-3 TaxID=2789268 RepID=UPI00397EEF80
MLVELPMVAARGRVLRLFMTVAFVGSIGLFGVGSAAADPTLRYTCPYPLIGDQPMTASVVWNTPHTHVVGRATPRSPVNTSATVSSTVTQSLRLAGATTVEGTADVTAVVTSPQGDIPILLPLKVPVTDVPDSGSLTVKASGTLPSLVFRRPGAGKVIVGGIALHITPRDASGDETALGKVDSSCDLNSGQDGVLASFKIRSAGASPTASETRGIPTAGSSGAGGSAGSGGSDGSAGPSTSASGRPASPDPDADPSDTASGKATASVGGAPTSASPAASATGGSDFAAPLRAAVSLLVVSATAGAAALGCVWWRRQRRADVDGPED